MKEKLAAKGASYVIDQPEFDKASGVGINVTEDDCQKLVDGAYDHFKKEIDELKYDFQFNKILYLIKDQNKWADSKVVMAKIAAK